MTVPSSHAFEDVLALPVTKIQAAMAAWSVTPTDSTRCFMSLASDDEIARTPCDDRFVVVRPKQFPEDSGMQAGGGTATQQFDGTLDVIIWNRLDVDQATRSDKWITHSTLGTAVLISLVTRALSQYWPLDSSNNAYFIQPMRLLAPGWVFPTKKVGDWGQVTSSWSLVFWFA